MTATPRYVVAAYNALAGTSDPVSDAAALYASLRRNPLVGGFEVPFRQPLDDEEIGRLADFVGPDASVVLTTIPGVMLQLVRDPSFGLASTDRRGRANAVEFAARAYEAVLALNRKLGRPAVEAVLLASAPRRGALGTKSSRVSLMESLQTVLSWEWDGAKPVIEHCDAWVDWHQPAKGFLSLDDEVSAVADAVRTTGRQAGICVNWARSVIESREYITPAQHIALAREAGLLAGAVFSGCSPLPTSSAPAWADIHLPPASVDDPGSGSNDSLLGHGEMKRCLLEIGNRSSTFVGLKVAARRDADLTTRIRVVEASLAALRDADPHARATSA